MSKMERKTQKIIVRNIFNVLTKIIPYESNKVEKENDFIADGIDPRIAYRELTLNLKHQGYFVPSIISKKMEKATDYLVDLGII